MKPLYAMPWRRQAALRQEKARWQNQQNNYGLGLVNRGFDRQGPGYVANALARDPSCFDKLGQSEASLQNFSRTQRELGRQGTSGGCVQRQQHPAELAGDANLNLAPNNPHVERARAVQKRLFGIGGPVPGQLRELLRKAANSFAKFFGG